MCRRCRSGLRSIKTAVCGWRTCPARSPGWARPSSRRPRRSRRRRSSPAPTLATRPGSRCIRRPRSRRSTTRCPERDARTGHTDGVTAADPSAPAPRPPTAPGPKGHPLLGMLPDFRGDRLGFLVRTARDYGGVARFGLRRRSVFLVTDPTAVKRVLQDKADNYGRKTRSLDVLRETLGNGLLTTTGPAWWRNRRLAQPAFHKQRLAG